MLGPRLKSLSFVHLAACSDVRTFHIFSYPLPPATVWHSLGAVCFGHKLYTAVPGDPLLGNLELVHLSS